MNRLTKVQTPYRVEYDASVRQDGQVTSITDYDDSTLTYAYDAAGNVTSMTDYPSGWSLAKPVGRQRLERSEVAGATATRWRQTRDFPGMFARSRGQAMPATGARLHCVAVAGTGTS